MAQDVNRLPPGRPVGFGAGGGGAVSQSPFKLKAEPRQGPTPAERFIKEYQQPPGVNVELREYGGRPDVAALSWIERTTAPKGAGADAIRALASRADELGTTIRLAVEKENIAKLAQYYRQFGFANLAKRSGDLLMQRRPQGQE